MLKRFSAEYRPSDILAAFACLPKQEFDTLRRLNFTLSDEVNIFLEEHVPHFIRTMPSTTQHMVEDRSGPPRGRIDWMRTFARRTQAGSDPTLFVSRSVERTSDTSAARLFAFLLNKIVEGGEWLDKREIPEIARTDLQSHTATARRIAAIFRSRGVRPSNRVTGREVAPLRKSRRPDVIAAVRLYDLYVNVVELANENLLRNLLRRKQLAPEDLDDLFEVWTLLTLVELHLNEGWDLQKALLIGGGSSPKRPKFTMEKNGHVAELFYQTIPSEMGKSSAYKAIFREYDLDASMRRPDITARVTGLDGQVQRMIIEVKRTRDQGYILDSVYKTLGYLSDFKDTVGPNTPMAILVVWDGIVRDKGSGFNTPVLIVTAAQLPLMSLPY
ncbi:hypothetical protein ELH43_21770 [Rhizobium ruizarguesonis]|uniref:hypothetical protein n=1 Tax=Rhizobium ruizarguesonis TaxID=2081791 RepID=UPI0010319125|nr:hypothetical protein [Rhizobium ruizarguesonis]TBB77855.1 hypothetical protein ELH43_21770 [Rhizobium ruizarguesonis]